ncbi:MAG TPA: 7TM domain-containing protein [Candidatus Dojkabacteria bacterium]|nr:7TM domain-containing protein [Candidatus Dojkabacteria bacterium]
MTYSPFTSWILDNGVSQQTLELLVSITVVATIVSIFRYIFGGKSYGIYSPIILAIAYSYTGLKYGLAITAVVIITTLVSYSVLKKIRMHYITRIAINYCLLVIAILMLIIATYKYDLGLKNTSMISPLALVSIATLSDFFVKQFTQKSLKTSFSPLIGTIVIASIGWYIITSEQISQYMINNLWIIPLLIFINILIGQFKELRIKEILRFNSIVGNKDNAQK